MTMIQIRNVPESLHRKLKARAAQAGMSLSDYLLREIQQVAKLPTMDEMLSRIRERPPLKRPVDIAAMVREERDRR